MLIISVLALAAISIGLFVVTIMLRSRSVASLNFFICLIAMFVIQPWTWLAMHPPRDEDMRLNWIASWVWVFISACSVVALLYTIIYAIVVYMKKPLPQTQGKRRKRRRKGKTRAEHLEETGQARRGVEENGDADAGGGGSPMGGF